MGEKGMLSLGNPPNSGLQVHDKDGLALSPPDYSFPQRFRKVGRPAIGELFLEPLFAVTGATPLEGENDLFSLGRINFALIVEYIYAYCFL